MTHRELHTDAVALLQALVRTPSYSREEGATADILERWLAEKLGAQIAVAETDGVVGGVVGDVVGDVCRAGNNVWVSNLHFDANKPTILLCSHHDTVRPAAGYTRDPLDGAVFEGRLWGLGSNDAGASVVSLAAAFRWFYDRKDLAYNLLLALVAEEEISGAGGLRSILPKLGLSSDEKNAAAVAATASGDADAPEISDVARADRSKTGNVARADRRNQSNVAVVGEPTGMQMAIAERGLLVLDCTAHGRSGHAARNEGDNAIYHALKDIEWFRTYRFPRTSPLFGDVKMSVTMISAGTGHNVVPAECRFTVDVRVNEQYTNEEVLSIVRQSVTCDVVPRSMHLRPSAISPDHSIIRAGKSLGLSTFGSPTTSDQVVLDIDSVKIGPGDSARSHTADEYIEIAEIEQGIELYIKLLEKIL